MIKLALPSQLDHYQLENNTHYITKWNWDYQDCEKFQYESTKYLKENPSEMILISCSHPHCFTYGRGLQKGRGTQELQEFDTGMPLPFPMHQISRGGGLTFHYPGQFIFYPIINFNYHKKNLARLMINLLKITSEILEIDFQITELDYRRELLGLWHKNHKIASVGMNLERFVSMHGLAFNFFHDEKMFQALKLLSPCGINGNVYTSLESISKNVTKQSFLDFQKKFLVQFERQFD